MLKKRVAATVVVKDDIVVQSILFNKYLPIGKVSIALDYLNKWGIDEIILIDISATKKHLSPNYELIKEASSKCQVPLTIGGGINNLKQIHELMQCGADKISLNQSALINPKLITEAAHIYGDQCIVVSIDAMKVGDDYRIYDYIQKKTLSLSPAIFAKRMQNVGAGEILINAVHKDGTYSGFDVELCKTICDEVKIPVIASGGAKNANDFIQIFTESNVSAATAANMFQFIEHSVNITKAIVKKTIDIRLETHATYEKNKFDHNFRLLKHEDKFLEELLFIKIEKEVI